MNKNVTYGQSLIGVKPDPKIKDNIWEVKMLFAKAIDSVHTEYIAKNMGGNPSKDMLYKHAIGEILNAQMNAVKVLTLDK